MPEYFSLEYVEEQMGEPITGVVHIGAHYGEEAPDYAAHNLPVVWVEGHPLYADKLIANVSQYPNQYGFEALLSDKPGEYVDFWITADEYASSMLKPAYHQIQNPHAAITGTIKLQTQVFSNFWLSTDIELKVAKADKAFNLLVLDVQGAESKVWGGMSGNNRKMFKAIISEYSTVEFYEGVPQLEDLDRIYEGFTRVYPDDPLMHGDALYIRR